MNSNTPTHARAFTLVELLVVVAIIGILIGLLLPALSYAIDAGKLAKCSAQLKNIGMAMRSYQNDHNGMAHPRVNGARWFAKDPSTPSTPPPSVPTPSPAPTPVPVPLPIPEPPIVPPTTPPPATPLSADPEALIAANDPWAYWGVAYVRWGAQRELHGCPSAEAVRELGPNEEVVYTDGPFAAGHIYTTYGFNGVNLTGSWGGKWSPLFQSANANAAAIPFSAINGTQDAIIAQDAYEQMLDGGGDTPREGLTQYNSSMSPSHALAKKQYFRHKGGGVILWADSHVSHFVPPNNDNSAWLERWYVRARDTRGIMK